MPYNMRDYDLVTVKVIDPISKSINTMKFGEDSKYEKYWMDEMGLHYSEAGKDYRQHIPMHRIINWTSE
jgi:hypothetical protein